MVSSVVGTACFKRKGSVSDQAHRDDGRRRQQDLGDILDANDRFPRANDNGRSDERQQQQPGDACTAPESRSARIWPLGAQSAGGSVMSMAVIKRKLADVYERDQLQAPESFGGSCLSGEDRGSLNARHRLDGWIARPRRTARAGILDDARRAAPHHQNAVGQENGFAESEWVMKIAVFGDLSQMRARANPISSRGDGVERAERLVHQQDARVVDQCAGQATRCRMPPDNSRGRFSRKTHRSTMRRQRFRRAFCLSMEMPRRTYRPGTGHCRERFARAAASGPETSCRLRSADPATAIPSSVAAPDVAGSKPANHQHQCALAAAGWPENGDEIAPCDLEVSPPATASTAPDGVS